MGKNEIEEQQQEIREFLDSKTGEELTIDDVNYLDWLCLPKSKREAASKAWRDTPADERPVLFADFTGF